MDVLKLPQDDQHVILLNVFTYGIWDMHRVLIYGVWAYSEVAPRVW